MQQQTDAQQQQQQQQQQWQQNTQQGYGIQQVQPMQPQQNMQQQPGMYNQQQQMGMNPYQQQMGMQPQQQYQYQQTGMNNQQQMGMYPQQQQQMMAQPIMPGMNQQMLMQMQMGNQAQYMMVNPDQFLLNLRGKDRLQNIQNVCIIEQERNICSDIAWGGIQASSWQIKSSQFAVQSLFHLKVNPFSNCQDKLPGSFYSIQFDQQQRMNEEKIYDLNHDRNCCFLKCCTGWWHICGALNWCILSSICPSSSTIEENGQKLATYKYSSCGSSVTIRGSDGNLKFIVTYKKVQDGSGNIIPNCQVYVQYGGHKNKTKLFSTIQFPQNMSVEDKAILIYGISKLA